MQLNIEKHNFCNLEGIVNVKNHLEKLNNVFIDESFAQGEIEINVSYNDRDGLECFKVVNLHFEFDLSELKILEIKIGKVDVFLIEGQGLDINYELIVNYLPIVEDKEIELIAEEDIKIEEKEDMTKIKEDMKEYYEEKLADNLEVNDRIIVTKSNDDVESFLEFFDNKKSYYKIKTLYVANEEELKNIAKEYNVSLEELKTGYDKKTHKVIFSLR